jgi:hypothetical protein
MGRVDGKVAFITVTVNSVCHIGGKVTPCGRSV